MEHIMVSHSHACFVRQLLEFVQELPENQNHGQQVEVIIMDYYKNSTTMVSLEKPTHELQTSSAADLKRLSYR